MISVAVYINNVPILVRSARRVDGEPGERCTYAVDDGRVISHRYDDGAAKLAIKLLQGVRTP